MKKLLTLSAFLGIFAGFMFGSIDIAIAQSTMSKGTSESVCKRKYVLLDMAEVNDKTEKVWKECKNKDDSGCKLRFCNAQPDNSDSTPTWKYNECNKYCVGFQEKLPLGQNKVKSISGNSGTDLMMNYVSMIYKFGAAVLGIVAVLIIVISGVQIITGGVDDNAITAAKDRILQAILSLVLLFSSALILKTINPGFFT